MTIIKNGIHLMHVLLVLIFQMLRQYSRLNSDIQSNFTLCQSICRKVVSTAGINLKVTTEEMHIGDEPFLLVSNHRCFFDVILLLAIIEKPVSFVAAEELYHYLLLHKYLKALECIPVDRSAKDFSKMKYSIKKIQSMIKEHNLVLFPEGECGYHDKAIKSFKRGAFMGVVGTDTKIIPVFIEIQEITNIGHWMIPKGDVRIIFGKGFRPKNVLKTQNTRELAMYTQKKVSELAKN